MRDNRGATGGTAEALTGGLWPGGESKDVRDAYDKQQKQNGGKR